MSENEDRVRVKHMLDAANDIIIFTKNESRESFEKDRKLQLALVRLIEIIGEAASRISNEFQQKHPTIQWKGIIGMRNRLIHAYFDIDLDRVWETIQISIPELLEKLSQIDGQ